MSHLFFIHELTSTMNLYMHVQINSFPTFLDVMLYIQFCMMLEYKDMDQRYALKNIF